MIPRSTNTSKNSEYFRLYGIDACFDITLSARWHLCGYDLNLTYPQDGHFPSLNPQLPQGATKSKVTTKQALFAEARARYATLTAESPASLKKRSEEWLKEKRDLSGRANGTIDSWYGCLIYEEMIDYALNFSVPWSESHRFVIVNEQQLGLSRFVNPIGSNQDSGNGFDVRYVVLIFFSLAC